MIPIYLTRRRDENIFSFCMRTHINNEGRDVFNMVNFVIHPNKRKNFGFERTIRYTALKYEDNTLSNFIGYVQDYPHIFKDIKNRELQDLFAFNKVKYMTIDSIKTCPMYRHRFNQTSKLWYLKALMDIQHDKIFSQSRT